MNSTATRWALAFLTLTFTVSAASNQPPANPNASPAAREILKYFQSLPDHADKRVLSGQFTDYGPKAADSEKIFDQIQQRTGCSPAILGVDYANEENGSIAWEAPNAAAIQQWQRGGLVAIEAHFFNPLRTNTAVSGLRDANVDVTLLLEGHSPAHKIWMHELDQLAAGLLQLRDAGVVVMWRPFHEMNGDWFWWGGKKPEVFIQLWRQMFDYFTQQKHLDNLLWVYAPNHGEHTADFYPGDHYVDLVGVDAYTDFVDPQHIKGTAQVLALPKPFGFAEFGPHDPFKPPGDYDYLRFIDGVQKYFPQTTWFLAWDWNWRLTTNRNVTELLHHPWMVNRADLAANLPWDRSSSAAPPPETANSSKYWAVEDAAARAKLPLYKIIPAAKPGELTPANGYPKRKTFLTWHRSHGDNSGARYSALDQINRQNVTHLQVAWTYRSGDGSNAVQCNPIIVRDLMIVPTPGRFVVGVNAETGEEVWRFKPEGHPAFRGMIYWPGSLSQKERVMFCSGKYLYALNPKNGQVIASFGENGRTLLPGGGTGEDDFGTATACPAIFDHIIVIPGFLKDVWGYDVMTGKQLWTFHTVPHPGEFGYDTWDRTVDYGANDWTGMAMDAVRGIAYIPTASAKPNFIGVWHRGDNLFADCLIALDARTGKRLWYFQDIPHDIWDRDISAPPNLATITHDGKRVDVVDVTTKNGDTLLLDRVTGKPIFPFRMRRAPTSDLPGEVTAPYQPDVELPQRFAKMEFTAADLSDRTPEVADYVATRFKSATTGFFRPASLGHPNLYFGMDGGAEWSGACIDVPTGRLYVSANHVGWLVSVFRDDDPPDDPNAPKTKGRKVYEVTCMSCHGSTLLGIGVAPPLRGLRFRLSDADVIHQVRTGKNGMPAFPQLSDADLKALLDYLMIRDRTTPPPPVNSERPRYSFTGYPRFLDNDGYPANKPPWGTLNCIDLNTGKLVWTVPLGEYPELAAEGFHNTGTENYGGPIVTAGGLVFCSGTRDSKIRAFDKDTGAELWSAKLPFVGIAPPSTYEWHGRQYVVITSTGNKIGKQSEYGDAYVAFALPQPGKK